MSFTEIKYALNRALGTDEFVPLDEMIRRITEKVLLSSETLQKTVINSEIRSNKIAGTSIVLGSFTADADGIVTVRGKGRNSYNYGSIFVLETAEPESNEALYKGARPYLCSGQAVLFALGLRVEKGKTYYFHLIGYATGEYGYCDLLEVRYDEAYRITPPIGKASQTEGATYGYIDANIPSGDVTIFEIKGKGYVDVFITATSTTGYVDPLSLYADDAFLNVDTSSASGNGTKAIAQVLHGNGGKQGLEWISANDASVPLGTVYGARIYFNKNFKLSLRGDGSHNPKARFRIEYCYEPE